MGTVTPLMAINTGKTNTFSGEIPIRLDNLTGAKIYYNKNKAYKIVFSKFTKQGYGGYGDLLYSFCTIDKKLRLRGDNTCSTYRQMRIYEQEDFLDMMRIVVAKVKENPTKYPSNLLQELKNRFDEAMSLYTKELDKKSRDDSSIKFPNYGF